MNKSFSSPHRLKRSFSEFDSLETPIQSFFYGKLCQFRKSHASQQMTDEVQLMTEQILTVNQFPAFYQAWEENLKNVLEVS